MPSTYKLTITKTDPAPTDNPTAWKDDVLYVHHIADEAAAKRIVHELHPPAAETAGGEKQKRNGGEVIP